MISRRTMIKSLAATGLAAALPGCKKQAVLNTDSSTSSTSPNTFSGITLNSLDYLYYIRDEVKKIDLSVLPEFAGQENSCQIVEDSEFKRRYTHADQFRELIKQKQIEVDMYDDVAVSYTHLRAPRDATLSRMPSSA